MHITTGTTTAVLDTLERDGYILRLADPDDRRRVLVDITPAAQSILDQALPAVQQLCTTIMAAIDTDAQEALLETLIAVGAALDATPDDLPPPAPRRPPRRLRRI
jgi:DNA-binding MarR family transcriptional regulator